MITEGKKQEIVRLMENLKDAKREKFAMFLASQFTDEDLRDLTPSSADKLLNFIKKL